ncbi:hypothetical protein Tco_0739393 [Tanacetum coccineum]
MAAPIISILFDSSKESVGSHASRVILFGAILVIISVIPEVPIIPADPLVASDVGTVLVVSPAEVLNLVDYSSSSDSDPFGGFFTSRTRFAIGFTLLCSDDSEADGESEPAKQRPMSSSHDTLTPSSESPTASVPSPTHILRSIAPTPADLLPPRKRFRDLYSPEDSREEHIEVDTADVDADVDDDEEFEAEASSADTKEIVVDPLAIGDSSESSRGGIPDLEDTIYDIVHYMSEEEFCQVRNTQRRLRRTMTITRSGMTPEAIEELVNRCVEEALAAHEATHAANALKAENQS